MKAFIAVVVLCLISSLNAIAAGAVANSWRLTLAEWSGPKTASRVLKMKPIRAAVQALDKSPGARLELLHNGGDTGVFWAADLKGWLISLGIPGSRILVHTGGQTPGVLKIELLVSGSSPSP